MFAECLYSINGYCGRTLDDEGRVVPAKLDVAFLPVRIPLVDWSRQLEKEDDSTRQSLIEADVLSDLMHCWLAQKYGEDLRGGSCGPGGFDNETDSLHRGVPCSPDGWPNETVPSLKTKKHVQHMS
eukprot:Skav212888  [mRNA]  locus=scaffold4893:7547:10239:- [translate_table: standard]